MKFREFRIRPSLEHQSRLILGVDVFYVTVKSKVFDLAE